MAYTKTNWSDKQVTTPMTYTVGSAISAGVPFTLVPSEGTVVNAGTPLNATNLNKIEQGIADVDTALTGKVAKSGDTMTGNLMFDATVERRVFASGAGYQHGVFINATQTGLFDWQNNRAILRYNKDTNAIDTTVPNCTFVNVLATNVTASGLTTLNGFVQVNNQANITSATADTPLVLQATAQDGKMRFVTTASDNFIQSGKVDSTAKNLTIGGYNASTMSQLTLGASNTQTTGSITSQKAGGNFIAKGNAAGLGSTEWLSFQDSAGTQQGYIGKASASVYDIGVRSDLGNLVLDAPNGTVRVQDDLAVTGNTTMSGTLNGFTIGTFQNDDNKGHLVSVATDGVAEIGSIIDFHTTGGASDYTARLSTDGTGKLTASNVLNALSLQENTVQLADKYAKLDGTNTFTGSPKINSTGDGVSSGLILEGRNTVTDSGIVLHSSASYNYLQSSNNAKSVAKSMKITSQGAGVMPELYFNAEVVKREGDVIASDKRGTSLWSGSLLFDGVTTLTPTIPLDQCPTGWMLEWQATSGTAFPVHTPIYKWMAKNTAHIITMPRVQVLDSVYDTATKTVLFTNTTISGSDYNIAPLGDASNKYRKLVNIICF